MATGIDAHQHFWRIARGDYGWMNESVAPLLRDFGPDDLAPHLARAGIHRTILVQAAPTEAETAFMLEIAAANELVAGVVGWLDMDSDAFPERLDAVRQNPRLVGIRPMLQDLDDDRWILRPRVLANLERLATSGLAFDILCLPRHLPHVTEALGRVPSLCAVLDHIAKPEIAAGRLDPWRADIAELARLPNVSCKVSGLVTEAAPDWRLEHFRPYVDHVTECFGEDRLIFGSDWPVATLAASYAEVANLARTLLSARFGPEALAKIFGGNAARFYRLSDI
ncbi:amidohydrolase family protein [Antarcticirhabdus aurantiaca]|uniref:Amidohydrolase family protein n=1 Tax=Antarcticirhabdus aurantiaca TaxID=2606717 RepID=A0ACD4NP38_9HYPH|nr:amidohydrolase family protein [Antarcticirhabdus aurantiaca]WAJ28538.1 amidohydrolase family protein [Jeongeuplla avenae]